MNVEEFLFLRCPGRGKCRESTKWHSTHGIVFSENKNIINEGRRH
jgi:hypothetical protein